MPQRNERAFAPLRVDALLRARPFLSVCSNRPEARSPRTLCRWLANSLRLPPPTNSPAPDSNLSRTPSSAALHRATALHWARTSPGLQAPLRSDEQQPCTGLELELALSTPTPNELHSTRLHSTALDSTRLHCRLGVPARPFMGYGGAFGLPPSTSHSPLAPPLLSF